ncbi:MAG: AAA family ATPase [bacterium]
MLKHLRIRNFKLWQDTGVIKMAPITLLFGVNSSGKSSIGQFLMMLKQTVESPDRKAVLYPGGKNTAVQLGSYKEIIYRRNSENIINFEYEWDLKAELRFNDPVTKKIFYGKTIFFEAEAGLIEKDQLSPIVNHLNYRLKENDHETLTIGMKRRNNAKGEYEVEAEKYTLRRKQGRVWYPGAPVRFYGFPDEVVAYHKNADFVQSLNLEHEKLFGSISYLGPLRTKAERLYSWTGIMPESVGFSGENAIAAILSARNRKINLVKPKARGASPARPFEEIIALKLEEMGLIEGFKVKAISGQRQEYEVKIRIKGLEDWVDLPDVGFGISQVLPVLVQCFYAPSGSIILMEQPEIHLHPSAQSALADVMIDVINA